uniref:pyrroline-5-carboxylate reductase n=1 Tax=Anaerovibrio slackiae TaxID=2652309 RepID=UPI00386F23F6
MEKKIGFIGGGAMAEAILSGAASKQVLAAENIFVSDHKEERCRFLQDSYGVQAFVGAEGFLSDVDILVLAIKPQVAAKAMAEVQGKLKRDAVLVSIVAGLTIDSIREFFPEQKIIRVMPNTPLSVGEGMSAYALSSNICADDAEAVRVILSSCGQAVEVKEYMLDAVTGLSGSGPAYGFLMIDALSDGGVAAGLPRATAILLAAQTLYGAAKMVLESGK